MKVLVCGSRTFGEDNPDCRDLAHAILSGLDSTLFIDGVRFPSRRDGLTVVEGGARGADSLGAEWGYENGARVDSHPADWETHGKGAGFIRNQQMLETGPDLVVAFIDKPLPLSRGTADMVSRARKAGVPTLVIEYQ